VEENALPGGFGAAVLEWREGAGIADGPVIERMGIPDAFQDQASRGSLLKAMGLDAEGIATSVTAAMERLDGHRAERSAS
jgi:1-deoxy-D-xylulose-5-phosphate synthase